MQGAGSIRVIVYKEDALWAAQCLEYDIGAQAQNLEDLQWRLAVAVEAEREVSVELHGEPFAGIEPAPRYFHEMWERRAGAFKPAHPRPIKDDGITLDIALAA